MAAARAIRIATYNILHGRLKGLDAIAEVLLELDADLIGLQEVDCGVERSGRVDQPASLAARLDYHHVFAEACPWGGGRYGLALLSRCPILGFRRFALPSRAILSLTDGTEPRVLLEAEVAAPALADDPLRVGVTHLGLDPTERLLQSAALAERMGGRRRTILCGDFNEGRTEGGYGRLLAAPFVDCIEEAGSGLLRTYPSHAPTIGIDHVLRSPDLPEAIGAWTIEADASDHLPVVVDLG